MFSRSSRNRSITRVALLADDIYIVHGAKSIAEVLRTSSLSVTKAYGIALKHCFGMAQKAVNSYHADTSGCQHKPIKGSYVQPQDRISYLTHENLLKGLLGTGLAPTSERFEKALTESLSSLSIGDEWVEFPNLVELFENHVGGSVIKAIFGSALLSQDPNFVRDLWAYDKVVMNLARRVPKFWSPEPYRLRDKLLLCIKKWHALARAHSDRQESQVQREEAEPFWGSEMIKDRHKMLLGVKDQDYDSLASTDLGFIWA